MRSPDGSRCKQRRPLVALLNLALAQAVRCLALRNRDLHLDSAGFVLPPCASSPSKTARVVCHAPTAAASSCHMANSMLSSANAGLAIMLQIRHWSVRKRRGREPGAGLIQVADCLRCALVAKGRHRAVSGQRNIGVGQLLLDPVRRRRHIFQRGGRAAHGQRPQPHAAVPAHRQRLVPRCRRCAAM